MSEKLFRIKRLEWELGFKPGEWYSHPLMSIKIEPTTGQYQWGEYDCNNGVFPGDVFRSPTIDAAKLAAENHWRETLAACLEEVEAKPCPPAPDYYPSPIKIVKGGKIESVWVYPPPCAGVNTITITGEPGKPVVTRYE